MQGKVSLGSLGSLSSMEKITSSEKRDDEMACILEKWQKMKNVFLQYEPKWQKTKLLETEPKHKIDSLH